MNTKASLLFSYDRARVREARDRIQIEPDRKRALFVAERGRVDFVYNTAALEGNPFTFPEVKTLLDGITVGGHKPSDAEQVLRLNQALSHVIELVKAEKFEFSDTTAKTIRGIVAKDEALKWGVFRNGPGFMTPRKRRTRSFGFTNATMRTSGSLALAHHPRSELRARSGAWSSLHDRIIELRTAKSLGLEQGQRRAFCQH
jgi:hypothetical protein